MRRGGNLTLHIARLATQVARNTPVLPVTKATATPQGSTRPPGQVATIIKGRTLDGILFDGTLEHAAEIGKFLKTGYTIEVKKEIVTIKLNEGKTEIRQGDFLVLNGQPLRVITKADIDLMWDTPQQVIVPVTVTWWEWLKAQV